MTIGSDDRVQRWADGPVDGVIPAERNRWFAGKYMAARDFSVDPAYLRGHHLLHNRLLHGQGVVCGLTVHPHPREDCAREWVVVRAGIGIDCYGREVVLHEDTAFRLPPLPEAAVGGEAPSAAAAARAGEAGGEEPEEDRPPSAAEEGGESAPGRDDEREEHGRREQEEDAAVRRPRWSPYAFVLCLRYDELSVEPVPVLFAEDGCTPDRVECNRIRESSVLVAHSPRAVCWGDRPGTPCDGDCDDRLPGPGLSCLTPDCACGDVVALALIDPLRPDEDRELPYTIDQDGRRHLPVPGSRLTSITGISWEHGGRVSVENLRHHRTLAVEFSRPLRRGAHGVDDFTFVVQYSNFQESVEFLPAEDDYPRVDGHRAIFRIDRGAFGRRLNIGNSRIFVTLKCDFIIDCRGNPVDGNHLFGKRPTGNGTPGGLFESWFTVG